MPFKLLVPFILSVFLLSYFPPRIFGDETGKVDSEKQFWSLSMLEGLRFVHCQDDYLRKVFKRDEHTQLDWFSGQKHCFGDVDKYFSQSNRFFRQIRNKINQWNETLIKTKDKILAYVTSICLSKLQICAKKRLRSRNICLSNYKKCVKSRKHYESRVLHAIWLIFRAQNITIAQFFLIKFLDNNEAKKLGEVIHILEKQGKVFDMTRYEKKMELNEMELESINSQLTEKFEFFKKNIKGNKSKNKFRLDFLIQYSFQKHLETLENIKDELTKVNLKWTEYEQKEIIQFWTIDKRPVVRQTLWLVRHAEAQFDIHSNFGKSLKKFQNLYSPPPLSERGIRQADELGKLFKVTKIDKVYASPFVPCLETAKGLISGEKGLQEIGINVEPGLSNFYANYMNVQPDKLCQLDKFLPLIDSNYFPVFNRSQLASIDIEKQKKRPDDQDDEFVALQTIKHILENNKKAENIVLVSHMPNIGFLLELMGAEWAAVESASVSKMIKYEENIGNGSNVLEQFRLEYSSGVTHLKERDDLHSH